MAYRDEVLADSPSAYFRLGETAGAVATDELGGAAGTYVGAVTLGQSSVLPADANLAVGLDGATGFVRVADRAAFDLGDVFTLEGWVRLAAVNFHSIVDKGSGGYILRTDAANRVVLRRNSVGDVVTSAVALSVGQPHHVVATKNGAAAKLYVDGADVTGAVTAQTIANTATELDIGSADGGTNTFLNGVVDEVALYPTVLSLARVVAHYAAGAALPTGGFPRLADGRLVLSSAAPSGQPRCGFALASSGALAASMSAGSWAGGFLRTAAGALCVAVDAAGSPAGGFLRDATGALCVTATGPFTAQAGFLRDGAGRLAVLFA